MRTALVGAAMLSASLPGAARADEATAVKAVERLGGYVTRDDKLPGRPVTGVRLGGLQVTDASLEELKAFEHLATVTLFSSPATGTGFKVLRGLKKLTTLELQNTDVGDKGMDALKSLEHLTTL